MFDLIVEMVKSNKKQKITRSEVTIICEYEQTSHFMVTGKRVATIVTKSGSIHAQIKLIIHIVPQKSVVLI